MTHKRVCDANHCAREVDATKGMCPAHWKMVPAAIQQRIYSAARAHKTTAQRLSSVDFLEAWADAVESVAAQEGRLTRNAFRNLANMVKARQLQAGTGASA
jgi:hypothetical protein